MRSSSGPAPGHARVLIVDDSAANRAFVRAALSRADIEADEAVGGREAVALSEDHLYDLILMDVHMPEMDGISALRAIRSGSGISSAAPIFAFTAEADSTRLAALRGAGFDQTVSKPVNIAELQRTVAAVIRNPELRREGVQRVA